MRAGLSWDEDAGLTDEQMLEISWCIKVAKLVTIESSSLHNGQRTKLEMLLPDQLRRETRALDAPVQAPVVR